MPEDEKRDVDQAEYRGAGSDLAAAVLAGAAGGAAGAVANQVMDALRKPKENDSPHKKS